MKKSVWIFLLAVFLPGAVLGWLALRGVEEQQIVFERRTAELYQKETEALASSVREAIEAERRAFGDAVHRLLARSDAEALSRDFTNTLSDVWPRKAIGFALSPDGNLVSPSVKSAAGNPELRNFIWDNGEWLCSTQPAVVYRVPIDNKLTAMGNQVDRGKGYANINEPARNFNTRNNDELASKPQEAQIVIAPSPSPAPSKAGEAQVQQVERSLNERDAHSFFRGLESPATPKPPSPVARAELGELASKVESKQKVAEISNTPQDSPPAAPMRTLLPTQPPVPETVAPSPIPALPPLTPITPAAAPVADKDATPQALGTMDSIVSGKMLKLEDRLKRAEAPTPPPATDPSANAVNQASGGMIGAGNGQRFVRNGELEMKPATTGSDPAKPASQPAERSLIRSAGAKPESSSAAATTAATPAPGGAPMAPLAKAPLSPPATLAPSPANPLPSSVTREPAKEMEALAMKDEQTRSSPEPEAESRGRRSMTLDREDAKKVQIMKPAPRADGVAIGGSSAAAMAPNLWAAQSQALEGKMDAPVPPPTPATPASVTRSQREGDKTNADSQALAFKAPSKPAPVSASKPVTKESVAVLKKDLPGGSLTLGIDARQKNVSPERNRLTGDAVRLQEQRALANDTMVDVNAATGNVYAFSTSEPQPAAQQQQWSQNRGVEPMQVLNAPSQALSSLVPSAAEFRVLTAMSDEGMVSRFVQDKLDLIFWIRPPEAPEMIFGCLVEAGNLGELWPNLLGRASETSSSTDNGHPSFVLALLDDKAKPMATLPAVNGTREWKRPFVASEIGEALPHWEAALYLATPGALAESARGLRRTLSFTVVSALALIILGAWLVVADIRRQLALAQQKTDFVSNVSHELKTPLTSIRMFAELMHDRPQPVDKQGQYLRIITVEAERLTRLINNVLDFAKLERRQKRFDKRPLDLHQVIARVWEGNEMHLRDAGFTTRWQAAPPPYPVQGDEDALSQVLVNLLSNAEKYSLETKEVELHTWSEDGCLCISVLDRGMGVPAGEERKIFESFYRAHDSLSSGIQGSGLGLTLAQRLAEEHGGKIEFSRREGGGSRFTLRLPLVAEDRQHPTGFCGPSDAFPSDSRPPTV